MTSAPKLGRIVKSADFARVLAIPPCARSQHFAVHHLSDLPGSLVSRTSPMAARACAVVDLEHKQNSCSTQIRLCLGTVIPKRHARSAVTRSLLKREIRTAMQMPLGDVLYAGLWVVRLRTPFDKKSYPSAASQGLRTAARDELATAVNDAIKRIKS